MRIANNLSAMGVFRALNSTNKSLERTINALSTGLRINSASDDAAGFAVSEKMRSQISGLDTAIRNTQDGMSLLQTAEGALDQTNAMLQRMRDLSVQASNDSLTSQDRQYIQLEIDQIRDEIDRIAGTTQFNKKRILDGSSGALWSSSDSGVKVRVKGGLTSTDNFGQKVSSEGNYRIEVKAEAGQAQVQKSNIMNFSAIELVFPEEIGEVEEEEAGHNYNDVDIALEELSGTMSGNGWSFADGTLTINASGSYHIYGTNTQTTNHVVISSGVEADVLLENVNINPGRSASFAGFELKDTAKVELFLSGDNQLGGGSDSAIAYRARAALEVPDGAEITINSSSGFGSFEGSLTAQGGESSAGIGGRNGPVGDTFNGSTGTITINGGTINATGGYGGAGIGTGYLGTSDGVGTITINGGNVTAKGGRNLREGGGSGSAGIGTGVIAPNRIYSNKTVINITGGTVYAEGGGDGAGIGGGWDSAGGDITISGGTITAIGGTDFGTINRGGAGIGGGCYGNGGNITITGGEITATGGFYAAGIGGGISGTSGTIKIQEGLYKSDNTGAVKAFKGPDDTENGGDLSTALDVGHGHDNTVNDVDVNADLRVEEETPAPATQIREFYNSVGNFLLDRPQTLTITQGDGKTASVTLYATDTMQDVAAKINDAIADTLGQSKYTDKRTKFCTLADGTEGTSEAVYRKEPVYDDEGSLTGYNVYSTMLVRSAVPGKEGELSFSGDDELLRALGLNTIQESSESRFTTSIYDAHSGKIVASGIKTTGSVINGAVMGVDVEFDSMAGIKSTWDEGSKRFVLTGGGTYSATLHLKDKGITFQTGANNGEDFMIQLGDMSSQALGISGVNLTTRESAARSIGILDRAINRVSSQRAKIGAYTNALEHTHESLTVTSLNLTAAESRIRDADMSATMMKFVKLQILNQSGTSMLAQANQMPQSVLSLLGN